MLTRSLSVFAYTGHKFDIAGEWKEQLNIISEFTARLNLICFTADEAGGYFILNSTTFLQSSHIMQGIK